jgi:hypothetical protein
MGQGINFSRRVISGVTLGVTVCLYLAAFTALTGMYVLGAYIAAKAVVSVAAAAFATSDWLCVSALAVWLTLEVRDMLNRALAPKT